MALTISVGLGWLLVAFFAVTGLVNIAGSPGIRAGFVRWGYPAGMHFVTGALELIAAVLMALPSLRVAGVGLALIIMVAALATVVRCREFTHAVPPALTIAALLTWSALLQAGAA